MRSDRAADDENGQQSGNERETISICSPPWRYTRVAFVGFHRISQDVGGSRVVPAGSGQSGHKLRNSCETPKSSQNIPDLLSAGSGYTFRCVASTLLRTANLQSAGFSARAICRPSGRLCSPAVKDLRLACGARSGRSWRRQAVANRSKDVSLQLLRAPREHVPAGGGFLAPEFRITRISSKGYRCDS